MDIVSIYHKEIYYAVSLFLMIGCGVMSHSIGKRDGVMRFLSYLEDFTDNHGKVTVRITETDFEVLK